MVRCRCNEGRELHHHQSVNPISRRTVWRSGNQGLRHLTVRRVHEPSMQPEQPNIATVPEPDECDRLKEDLRREHERYLRLMADFDNYRRRVQGERTSTAQSGKRSLLLSLVGVLDDFDRALQHAGEMPPAVLEGLQAIHRKLLAQLEAHGVKRFSSVGETFNPDLHEAVGLVSSEQHPSGVVVEEEQPGYRWGDDLLRPARVRVSR
jgi:molecular chaperone GrpE